MTHEQAVRLAGELERLPRRAAQRGGRSRPARRAGARRSRRALAGDAHLPAAAARRPGRAILAEEGRLDARPAPPPADRRPGRQVARARRRPTRSSPPASPARIPSVARLLARIARLPGGCVVVPALDRTHRRGGLGTRSAPSHPQYGLKRLLELMEVDRAAVRPWPQAATGTTGLPARVELWCQVLRPAGHDRGLAPRRDAPARGHRRARAVAEAPDLASEAMQIALRLREALEAPGQARRPGHAQPVPRPAGRGRAAALGHPGRRQRRRAARPVAARHLPPAHRASRRRAARRRWPCSRR